MSAACQWDIEELMKKKIEVKIKKKKPGAFWPARRQKNGGAGSESRRWVWSLERKLYKKKQKRQMMLRAALLLADTQASSLTLMIINQRGLSGNEATLRQLQAADSWHYLHRPAMNYSDVFITRQVRLLWQPELHPNIFNLPLSSHYYQLGHAS